MEIGQRGVDGKSSQILAENATLVEYNQALIVIEPEQEYWNSGSES